MFGRGLFVLALFVPLMPEAWRIPGLLTIAALSQLILAPVSVLWTSWMADLVPDQLRGRYFGLRNGLLGLVGTLGNLAAGGLIDALGKPWGFLLVLGLAVGAGVGATFILRRQFEPPMVSTPPRPAEYIQPLSDRRFRGFLGFVVLFLGAVSVGGPFVFPLFLEYARMSFTQVGLWTVIAASCGLVLSPLWGRLADRIGHWQVLLFSSSVAALVLPLCGWPVGRAASDHLDGRGLRRGGLGRNRHRPDQRGPAKRLAGKAQPLPGLVLDGLRGGGHPGLFAGRGAGQPVQKSPGLSQRLPPAHPGLDGATGGGSLLPGVAHPAR